MAEAKPKSIGITGAASGVGVTHLAVTLANYSAAHKKRKTAVIELSGNHAFEKMTGTSEPGEWNRVAYYPNVKQYHIAEILSGDYEVVIFDMGNAYYRVRTELLRCDEKLIVGSLAPWRKAEYENFVLEEMGEDRWVRGMIFLAQYGMKRDKKDFVKTAGVPVYNLPFIREPVKADKTCFEFLNGFLV